MCTHYLGHGFDIHAGGMDLIFPHHENEIAQSEASAPQSGDLARVWVHNGFVNVDKEKMSKSLGNFVTVRDVLERNDPEAFRWFLLSAHYRGPIQFDTDKLDDGRVVFPGVDEAERRVDYLYSSIERLRELMAQGQTAPAKLPDALLAQRGTLEKAAEAAEAALDDDLNTPVALASLGEMMKLANELCDSVQKRKKDAAFVGSSAVLGRLLLMAIEKLSREIGLLQASPAEYRARTRARRLRLRGLSPEQIDAKVEERRAAREQKDFARGDALRAELAALGVTLHDTPAGTHWSIEQ
jgi:cysteinyl-tRNA synthetase